ncbi:hypothetical protein EUA04_08380 [Mycolicibacterium obuense]|uniref:Uncharacterized protein n=1 Tax=Mycolicibacterium obuense TaxID=1807 RepID=A0A4R5X8C5_9MYCO|nr:hypothetical protein [Mycolicibacterium obuense]TDL09954.1 hypothetical protein EUA04_08380 [Mycolicibacterium obuense]
MLHHQNRELVEQMGVIDQKQDPAGFGAADDGLTDSPHQCGRRPAVVVGPLREGPERNGPTGCGRRDRAQAPSGIRGASCRFAGDPGFPDARVSSEDDPVDAEGIERSHDLGQSVVSPMRGHCCGMAGY